MMIFSVVCSLFTVLLTLGAEINIEGNEDGEVSFKCSHRLASNNKKYLCKDLCTKEDILVYVTPGEVVKSGRITLLDSEDGSVTVTITHLRLSDARLYWCAVIRSLGNTYTSVNLTISKVSSPWFPGVTNSTQMMNTTGTNRSGSYIKAVTNGTAADEISISLGPLLYAAAGTSAALIIFIVAVYFRKHRKVLTPQLHVCSNYKDPRSEGDKGAKTDKRSPGDISLLTGQCPKTASIPIYENFPPSSQVSDSNCPPTDQQNVHDEDSQIYITALPSAVPETNSVSPSACVNPPSGSLWFGLDVSRINQV